MTNTNLEALASEYRKYKQLEEEAKALADSLADEIKAYMAEINQSKLIVGEYKISHTEATRSTLDKKQLEQDLGCLAAYTKTTAYKIFKVA